MFLSVIFIALFAFLLILTLLFLVKPNKGVVYSLLGLCGFPLHAHYDTQPESTDSECICVANCVHFYTYSSKLMSPKTHAVATGVRYMSWRNTNANGVSPPNSSPALSQGRARLSWCQAAGLKAQIYLLLTIQATVVLAEAQRRSQCHQRSFFTASM